LRETKWQLFKKKHINKYVVKYVVPKKYVVKYVVPNKYVVPYLLSSHPCIRIRAVNSLMVSCGDGIMWYAL